MNSLFGCVKKTRLAGSLLIALLMLGACTSNTQLPVYQAQHIVLLPTQAMYKELQNYEQIIDNLLQARLEKTAFIITVLSEQQYKQLNERALESSGAIYDPNLGQYLPLNTKDYAYALESLISQKMPVDALFMPRLLLRDGAAKKQKVAFDGVVRKLEYADEVPTSLALPTTKGLSIQLRGYSKSNNALKPAVGGISLPYRLALKDNRLVIDMKPSLFTDKEAKQGVGIAVKQLLAQLKYSK